MTTVPRDWTPTTLGQLGRYINGRGFKKTEWSDHGRPIIRIQNLTGSTNVVNRFAGELDERHVVRPGDLLVSWAATLGAYIWSGEEGALNQHIFKVESRIDQKFHKYLLDYKLAELMRHTHGSGMVHITRSRFDELPVAVPGVDEQRRIVDILEDHLSRLDAANDYLDAAERRAEMLVSASTRAHVAAAALGGRTSTVGAHAVLVEYGTSTKTTDADEGAIPVLRMGNIKNGRVDWDRLKYLSSDHHEFPRLLLRSGDLLFNRTNSAEHVGKCAVFVGGGTASFASYLIRVRFDDTVLPEWASLAINSPQGRHYVASVASQQVGQANVNGSKLRAFPLPVPSLDEQRARVREHHALWDSASAARLDIAAVRTRRGALRRALLAAAFTGRLNGHASARDRAEELAFS